MVQADVKKEFNESMVRVPSMEKRKGGSRRRGREQKRSFERVG